jgi:hypothetical protein
LHRDYNPQSLTPSVSPLADRRTEIERRDRKQAAELGVEIVSEAAFAEIDRRIAKIQDANGWIETEPSRAAGALQEALGG